MSKPIEIDLTNQGDRAPAAASVGTALPGPTDPSPQAVSAIRRVSTGASFTPGPWNVDPSYPADIQAAGQEVATLIHDSKIGQEIVFGGHCDISFDQAKANAHLIAAAPELYASTDETHRWVRRIQDVLTGYLVPDGYDADDALNRLLEMLDGPEQREIQGRAFAALAKAQGK